METNLLQDATDIIHDMEKMEKNRDAVHKIDDKDEKDHREHEREQLISGQAHLDFSSTQKMGMGLRNRLKEKLV